MPRSNRGARLGALIIVMPAMFLACAVGDPTDTALQWKRAEYAGDVIAARALLSRPDSIALAAPGAQAFVQRAFATPLQPTHGVAIDSARVARTAGDTIWVAVYQRRPNWEGAGDLIQKVGDEYVNRMQDRAYADSLPKVTTIDTIAVLRERVGLRGRYRVFYDAALTVVVNPLAIALQSYDSTIATRAAAARAYRAAFDSAGQTVPSVIEPELRQIIEQASYLDSIHVGSFRVESVGIPGLPLDRVVKGSVENRSRRPLERVRFRVRFTGGESNNLVWASNIPPGRTAEVHSYGRWQGDIASIAIVEIVLAR
jgi:hypothetical protein